MEYYRLPDLPYAYNAIEPYIDARTMQVHHEGHHKGYVTKLNEIMTSHPDFVRPVDELLTSIDTLPRDIREGVRNNAGGHANHTLFWTLLSPKTGQAPSGEVSKEIKRAFGSFPIFKASSRSLRRGIFQTAGRGCARTRAES